MRTKQQTDFCKFSSGTILLVFILVLSFSFHSCQNDEFTVQEDVVLKNAVVSFEDPVLYWGHHTFVRGTGEPVTEKVTISGFDLVNFKGCLHLKIKARDVRSPLVDNAVVKIDGEQVVFPGDFNHTSPVITKEICGKMGDFTLETELRGKPGSCMEVWIEGIMKNPVTDPRDANIYPWVKIGNQIWLAKNLAYLPAVNQFSDSSRVSRRYYVYGYSGNEVNEAKATTGYVTFGVYYNWPAAMAGEDTSNTVPSGVRGACPEGWHLPSWSEWMILKNYLWDNGYGYEGNKYWVAKSIAAKTSWDISDYPGAIGNNPAINNSTGFTALASGYYSNHDPYFFYFGRRGHWWSSTESERSQDNKWIWYYNLCMSHNSYGTGTCNTVGWLAQSVRCIRN